jgi:outer membrane receptor protein involved in Fe transport
VVAFWTEFRDMIEFKFGSDLNNPYYFQSQNTSHARIFGWETSLVGEGKMGPVDMTVMLGYTYFYGVDMNDTTWGASTRNGKVTNFLGDAFNRFVLPTAENDYLWDSLTSGMLMYRHPHTFKADLDFIVYDKYHFGTAIQYYSYMTRIDKIFGIFIKGINEDREVKRNKGDVVWDLRAGYDVNKNLSFNFIVKNVLNTNYAIRVARPEKPRTFTFQMIVNFGGNGKRSHPGSSMGDASMRGRSI